MKKLFSTLKAHPRLFIIPLIGLVITFYFTYHAIKGERGFIRLIEIIQEIEHAEMVLAQTDQEKEKMERKVKALSPENLDIDMVEESGRRLLNVGEKKDFIIFDNANAPASP